MLLNHQHLFTGHGKGKEEGIAKGEKKQEQTVFLIQQLYLLQDVFPHFGKAGAGFLPTPKHQTVLIVTSAHAVQRLPHGLSEEK